MRTRHSAEFKAKVALEAIKSEETIAQLSAKYGVHPNMITQRKPKAQKGMVEVFSPGKARKEKSHEDEVKELHAKIGLLTVKRDFLFGPSDAGLPPEERYA